MTKGGVKSSAEALAAARLSGRTGRRFWRALEELADAPAFRRALAAQFPQAFTGVSETGRREVLKAMGASLGLAGLDALEQSDHPRM